MKKKKINNTISLDQFIEKEYGPVSSKKRKVFEKGYENFKLGVMLQEARKKKGLTQEELALKIGTTKSYISKIENAKGNIQLSTLIRIFEKGLDRKIGLTFL